MFQLTPVRSPSVAVANQYPEPTGHLGFQLYLIMSDSPTMIPVKGYDTLANAKTGAGAFVTPTVTPWVDSTDGSQSLSAVFAPA